MISLERIRNAGVIHDNFRDEKRLEFEFDLLFDQRRILRKEKDDKGKVIKVHAFKSSRWGKSKPQLKVESHDKCAYCEAPMSVVAHGDVEHFRPKKIYWWLAYNYDNYLVSCQLCNQKFKSANFPVRNDRLPEPKVTARSTDTQLKRLAGKLGPNPLNENSVSRFARACRKEAPLLLNPYFDDPAPVFGYELSHVTKEVLIVPHPENEDAVDLVKAAEDFYGLNRTELRSLRYIFAKPYATLRAIRDSEFPSELPRDIRDLLSTQRAEARDSIDQMMQDDHPFAGMIRYFELWEKIPELEI